MKKVKDEATKMLERCFSSKDKKKRIEGYLLCDEEFKLSKTKFSVTKTIGNIDDDGTIQFIDMYYLSDYREGEKFVGTYLCKQKQVLKN